MTPPAPSPLLARLSANPPEVQILCGMIASGKSTYAKQKAREGWVVINDDAIVFVVHGGDYALYDKSLKPLYKGVETTMLTTAVGMGLNVVVDNARCVSRETRQRFISVARSLDAKVSCVVFEVAEPQKHALRRMVGDHRGLSYKEWLEVAMHHQSIYSPPTEAEGFAEIIHAD